MCQREREELSRESLYRISLCGGGGGGGGGGGVGESSCLFFFHLHVQSRTPALIFEHVDNTDFKVNSV